jgi:hypothetical protein
MDLSISALEWTTYAAASTKHGSGGLGAVDHYELFMPKQGPPMTANAGIYSTGNSEEPRKWP